MNVSAQILRETLFWLRSTQIFIKIFIREGTMKKYTSVLLICVMLLGALLALPVSAAPSGTAIKTESEFLKMSAGGTYYLDADITLKSTYSSAKR